MQDAPVEHSAVLLTCIKLPHGFKSFVLSILSGRLRQVSLYYYLFYLQIDLFYYVMRCPLFAHVM